VTAKGELWRASEPGEEGGRGSKWALAYPKKVRRRRCLAGVEVTVSRRNEVMPTMYLGLILLGDCRTFIYNAQARKARVNESGTAIERHQNTHIPRVQRRLRRDSSECAER
jgi:hypothetical protein